MKLKTVTVGEKTYAEIQDGKPIYIGDDGKEIAFDVPHTAGKIRELNAEAKTHRERAEAAEAKLATYKDIADPAAALKALNTVKNLDDKKLVDAGEIERVKAAAIEAIEAKYKPVLEERDRLLGENKSEKLGNAFGKSKIIADKLILPADAVQAIFGSRFDVKDGRIIAKDWHGNAINSKSRPGDPADFDEAIDALIDGYVHKDAILKGTGNKGDGKQPGSGANGANGAKTIARAEFDKLDPAAKMKAVNVDKLQVVDAA